MKFFVFGYILSFIFTFNVYAETVDYSEIIPGLTLRYEVNELLGSPVEEVITGSVYRYTSNHYAIKYIDVTYIRKTNRVEFYSLYFKKEYYKNDILYLFDLYEPVHKLLWFRRQLYRSLFSRKYVGALYEYWRKFFCRKS